MSDNKKTEQQIVTVLNYQDKELSNISFSDISSIDKNITDSEKILLSLGYDLPKKNQLIVASDKPVMLVPSWESLCKEAERVVGDNATIESLFTSEELLSNKKYISYLSDEFNQLYKLDKFDVTISAFAGIVGAAVDLLLVGIPQKSPEGLTAGKLSDFIRKEFDKKFPPEEMENLANSKISKVPYDAQDNRNTVVDVEGLSAYYHRLLSLGHDPLLGFVIGVADILSGNMTTIDKNGKIVIQKIAEYADRKEMNIFAALAKQWIHFKSDVTTSMGLPAPLMGLFNLLQFGSIGEAEQTIAEIVRGMYYEGYDFVHFCSMSIPVMLVEVIVRIGYAFKRIKEGHSIKDSIPLSLNREKNPKLPTMLFIAHSASTAINAGKVYFTQNPLAINYPQWLAFGKYSYTQLKWVVLEKPEMRDQYVMRILNDDLFETIESIYKSFDDYTKNYIVVIDSQS